MKLSCQHMLRAAHIAVHSTSTSAPVIDSLAAVAQILCVILATSSGALSLNDFGLVRSGTPSCFVMIATTFVWLYLRA